MPQEIFISYSSKDSPTAQAVCQAIENAGFPCWIAPRNIAPGREWSEEIIDALNGCRAIVLIFSTHSNDSPQVLREIERGVNKRLPILVFRIEEAPLSKAMEYFLSVPHWFDALQPPLSAHLTSLTQAIASLLDGTPAAPIPSPTPTLPQHNLPNPLTSFIGRERECLSLQAALEASPAVTLTGFGGCGKTRLCLQVAQQVLAQFPDGAWLVELAPLSDPALLPQAVAEVLSVQEQPGEPLSKTLLTSIKEKKILLIIDNCEHLLDAAAELASALLRGCPRLRLLLSSRESLGIPGEKVFPVASLAPHEAEALFLERAKAAKADFNLTPENQESLASLCQRLDGIPMALELAAARIRSIPLEQLTSRLDDRFKILTGGSRTALPRQQTLRALIDWSYDLLEENQKTLLCRLSVFAGGFTLDAAEGICSGAGVEDWELLDLLTALHDKSLVVYEESKGEARYQLLETIRQYAAEKLTEHGESEAFHARHHAYFAELARSAELELVGEHSAHWLRRLAREYDNLRAALEWCHASPDGAESGLRLVGYLYRFWHNYGLWSEGRHFIDQALQRRVRNPKSAERVSAFHAAGFLMATKGDTEAALYYLHQCLRLHRQNGDRTGIATTLGHLGVVSVSQGNLTQAALFLEESLQLHEASMDIAGIAATLLNLGEVARQAGELDLARSRFETALVSWQELKNAHAIAVIHNNLARIAHSQGRYEDAWERARQGLQLRVELQDRQAIVLSLEVIAAIALAQERFEETVCLLSASRALCARIELKLSAKDLDAHECHLTRAREALTEEAFLEAQARGARLDQEQAATYALELSSGKLTV